MKTYRLTKDLVILQPSKIGLGEALDHVLFRENSYFVEHEDCFCSEDQSISKQSFDFVSHYFEEVSQEEVDLVKALVHISTATFDSIKELEKRHPNEFGHLKKVLGVQETEQLKQKIKDLETQLFLKTQTWSEGDWTVTSTVE
jgi:hypothetical protein